MTRGDAADLAAALIERGRRADGRPARRRRAAPRPLARPARRVDGRPPAQDEARRRLGGPRAARDRVLVPDRGLRRPDRGAGDGSPRRAHARRAAQGARVRAAQREPQERARRGGAEARLTLVARDLREELRRLHRPRRRVADGGAGRPGRRRRAQRRRQVDAAAHPRRRLDRPTRARSRAPRGDRRLPAPGARPAPGESLRRLPRPAHRRRPTPTAARRRHGRARRAATPGADDAYSAALERGWRSAAPTSTPAPARCCATSACPRPARAETAALSGGQAARASLAAILLSRFDVFLLDEPTNDLDFDGLDRLERFVAELPGGAVVVSHDRAFLERVVTRVLELDEHHPHGGRLRRRVGALPRAAGDAARRTPRRRYDDLRGQARRELAGPRPAPAPMARHGRAARPRRPDEPDKIVRASAIERTEKLAAKARRHRAGARPARGRSTSRGRAGSCAALSPPPRARRVVARLDGRGRAARRLHPRPVDLEIGWGERVALVGPERRRQDDAARRPARPHAARRRASTGVGPGVVVGELDQRRGRLRRRRAAARRLRRRDRVGAQEARSLLAKFGLGAEHVAAPADSLSPGERTRAGSRCSWPRA